MLHTPFVLFAAVLVKLLWSTEAKADQATYDTCRGEVAGCSRTLHYYAVG